MTQIGNQTSIMRKVNESSNEIEEFTSQSNLDSGFKFLERRRWIIVSSPSNIVLIKF